MWLTFLYVDDRLVVVDKPTGLLSVPGIGPDKVDCVVARAAARFSGSRIVHRLDMDTSGVLVLARDADTHRELSRQFHDREVEKTYIAVVHGRIQYREGTIDLPIRKDMENPPRQIVDMEQGRPSQTHWKVLERKNGTTRVELTPHTGRSHQLRLHLLALGHPIVGDDLYSLPEPLETPEPPEIPEITDQANGGPRASRLMLHACSLVFTAPKSGKSRGVGGEVSRMRFSTPCPF